MADWTQVECPRCGAASGEPCRSPRGRLYKYPSRYWGPGRRSVLHRWEETAHIARWNLAADDRPMYSTIELSTIELSSGVGALEEFAYGGKSKKARTKTRQQRLTNHHGAQAKRLLKRGR